MLINTKVRKKIGRRAMQSFDEFMFEMVTWSRHIEIPFRVQFDSYFKIITGISNKLELLENHIDLGPWSKSRTVPTCVLADPDSRFSWMYQQYWNVMYKVNRPQNRPVQNIGYMEAIIWRIVGGKGGCIYMKLAPSWLTTSNRNCFCIPANVRVHVRRTADTTKAASRTSMPLVCDNMTMWQ